MKRKKQKKDLSFYISVVVKLLYCTILLFTLSIFYFLVLISVESKSFPFVTKKVEHYINNNLTQGGQINIDRISIKLDNIYLLNINLENIHLTLKEKDLFLPKASAEFSLLNIITNQRPSKIKFEDAQISIDENITIKSLIDTPITENEVIDKSYIIKKIWDVFLLFKKHDIMSKEFEINNINLSFKDNKGSDQRILIKHSSIEINDKSKELAIYTNNVINLNDNKIDVSFNANCQFNEESYLQCDAGFFNLVPKTISKFIKGAEFLSNIDSSLSANFNIEINNNYEITSFLFNANANKGKFYYSQFFVDEIDFTDLLVSGEINNSLKDIKISKLRVDFDKDVEFIMSMDIRNLNNQELEETDMYFKISNSPGDKISKFWPAFLGPKIRQWVKLHIDQGLVKDAYANIKFRQKNNIKTLEHVDSEILFSKLRLNYSDTMPNITNADGIASFTKDNMKIDIVSGDVLNSKIKLGKISIDNFEDKKILLKINGSVSGDGSDLLNHISYNSTFSEEATNYLNGYGDSVFNIQIPIINDLSLADSYIKVLSNIKNINSKYFKNNSAINVSVLKKFGQNNFDTNIDFSNAQIDFAIANIFKDKNVPSTTHLDIELLNDLLYLNKINWLIGTSKINADIAFRLQPFELEKANISNNYGNQYNLQYEVNKNKSLRKLAISGEHLDLNSFIKGFSGLEKEVLTQEKSTIYNTTNIGVSIKKVDLVESQYINDLNINLNCSNSICEDSFIKALLSNKKAIDLQFYKKDKKDNYTTIEGNVSDVSLLARSFGISNQIIDGDTRVRATMGLSDNNISFIKGNLYINNGFSVIKNKIFDKIASDKAFESLKKDIGSADKISFDKLDLDFYFKDGNINVERLIASSYLMGFTAKGDIDLYNSQTKLKGLIIPGYSLNKLFGIGDIPVLGAIIMGEKGGGLFAIRYEYNKQKHQKQGEFNINAASAIVPGSIRNIFGFFD